MTDAPKPELLPCPFCGADPMLNEIAPHKHYFVDFPDHEGSAVVECPTCEAGMIAATVDEVVAIWNRRAPRPEIAPTLDDEIAQELGNVFRHLRDNQQPLDPDVARVLAESRSELYIAESPRPEITDAERWRYIRRKLCLSGNGDGTCAMQALNLPASIVGWPEPGEAADFCDAAIDAAIREERSRNG